MNNSWNLNPRPFDINQFRRSQKPNITNDENAYGSKFSSFLTIFFVMKQSNSMLTTYDSYHNFYHTLMSVTLGSQL